MKKVGGSHPPKTRRAAATSRPARPPSPKPQRKRFHTPGARDGFGARRPTGSSSDGGLRRTGGTDAVRDILRRPLAANAGLVHRAGEDFATANARRQGAEINEIAQTDPEAAVEAAQTAIERTPPGSPQREALIEELGPTFEAAGDALADSDPSVAFLPGSLSEDLARVFETSGNDPEVAEAIARGVGPDRPSPFFGTGLAGGPAGRELAAAVNDAHRVLVSETQALEATQAADGADAVADVEAATAAAQAAQEEVAALDAQLAAELSIVGPGLSEEERADFVANFHDEHAEVYQAEAETAATLADALSHPDLEHAAQTDPALGASVVDGLEALATSSAAGEALDVLAEINDRPDSPLAAQLAQPTNAEALATNVVEAAITSAASDLLADADGDPQAAAAALASLTRTALRNIPGLGAPLSSFLGNLDKLARGDIPGAIAGFGTLAPGQFGNAFAAAGLIITASAVAGTAHEQDFVRLLGSLASQGASGLRLFADVAQGIADGSSRFADNYGPLAAASSEFAERFVPLLNIVSEAAGLVGNLDSLRSDPSVGAALSALGSVASTLGAILAVTPAAPLAPLLSAVGALVSGIGGLVSALEDHSALSERALERLLEIGVEEEVAELLVEHSRLARTLAENLALSPEQIQDFLLTHDGTEAERILTDLANLGTAAGLEGEDFIELVDTLLEEGQSISGEDPLTLLSQLATTEQLSHFDGLSEEARRERLVGLLSVYFPASSEALAAA